MGDLLLNPAVQAGVLPFVAALIVAVPMRKTRHLGLAVAAAFLCAVYLTMGFDFESLTSLKKLVLAGVAFAAAGVLLEYTAQPQSLMHRVLLAAATCAAALWALQRIFTHLDMPVLVVAGTGAVAYCLALLAGGERVAQDPVCAAATALVLGLVWGTVALLGASAQLAQLGIALAAGAGAVLLVQVCGAAAPRGWTLGLSAQVVAALVGLLAVATGSLPWFCLLPIPLVAWAARLPAASSKPPWYRAALSVSCAIVPAALAVALAWFTAGDRAA